MPITRQRFEFLEGTRGIAALQVVILHYCAVFLSYFAKVGGPTHYQWESDLRGTPLFFLADGYTAVCVFFLMSGFVLAPSFIDPRLSVLKQAIKRFIRLFLPVSAAVILAIALSLAIPSVKVEVVQLSQSPWVSALFENALTPASLLKEFLASSTILGYEGISLFSGLVGLSPRPILSPVKISVNPPLWTIHIEFWCSIALIAVGYTCRKFPKHVFGPLFVLVLWLSGTHWLSLFLIGFAAYLGRHALLGKMSTMKVTLGLLFLTAGLYFSTCVDAAEFNIALSAISAFSLLKAGSAAQLQSEFSAVLILAGVVLLPPVRLALSGGVPMWLGKISFSLYLVHFPILFTVGFPVFLGLIHYFPYGVAAALTFVSVGAMTIVVAYAFQKFIDRTAIQISRKVTGRLDEPKVFSDAFPRRSQAPRERG